MGKKNPLCIGTGRIQLKVLTRSGSFLPNSPPVLSVGLLANKDVYSCFSFVPFDTAKKKSFIAFSQLAQSLWTVKCHLNLFEIGSRPHTHTHTQITTWLCPILPALPHGQGSLIWGLGSPVSDASSTGHRFCSRLPLQHF